MKQISQISNRFSFLNFARALIGFSIIMTTIQLSGTNAGGQQSRFDFTGIDSTFTARLEQSGSVSRMILQPDGKRIFIGGFNKAGGVTENNVVRVNPDNSVDTSFNFPENVYGSHLELLPDGKFMTYSRIAFNQAVPVRLNANGSIDSGFNFGRTLTITGIKFKSRGDGKVFAFGKFKVKKQSRVIAEDFILIDRTGGIESGFRLDYTGSITDVIPLSNGKTIICGSFEISRFGQMVGRNFAVLDENGSPDAGFDAFFGAQGESVYGADFQADGKLLVYGNFRQATKQIGLGGQVSKNKGITRFNPDGTFDRDFSVSFASASIYQTFIQPDGKIILRGGIDGRSYDRLYRIFPDGGIDATFNNNTPFTLNFPHRVSEVKIQPDGGILVAGYFKVTNRPDVQTLMRLSPDGAFDAGYQASVVGGEVAGMENLPDGKVLIWGFFGRVANRTRVGLARLQPNGLPDEKFRFDVLSTGSRVTALALQADGKILVGGSFSVVGGEYVRNAETVFSPLESNFPFASLVRLNQDGTLDVSFAPSTNTFDEILALAAQADGKVLIGGKLRSLLQPNNILRVNADGSKDMSFNRLAIAPYEISKVNQIVAQPDGKILVGGYFNQVGGFNRVLFARLNADGLLDESLSYNQHFGAEAVNRIVLQPDGKIIIGGEYLGFSTTIPGLPRFNPDATLDMQFQMESNSDADFSRDIQLQADGKIWFSGRIGFPEYENYHPYALYRMNQNGEIEAQFNVDANRILPQADGRIVSSAPMPDSPDYFPTAARTILSILSLTTRRTI